MNKNIKNTIKNKDGQVIKKGGDDIKTQIDYSALFNDFVRDRFNNDKNIKYNSLDELSRARENLIAKFVEHGKKIGIDISDDVAKTLFLDASSVSRVLYSDRTKKDIVKTSEDFKQYVDIISKMKSSNEPLLLKDFWRISSPIAKNTVPVDDMLKFMSEHVETKFNMSFSSLYHYVYSKIKQDTKWTYENTIELLSYSKNFSKKDRDFKYDLENHFLYLLRYIFENADENVDMEFWQNVFNWINENMPHIYFSDKLLKDHGYCLTSVCKWNGISLCTDGYGKIKVEHDYSYVEEQFEFFVWSYFRVTAKYCEVWDIHAKDYSGLKTEKFKSLSEIKSACSLLMDQFFKKYSRDITANCVKIELRNKLQLRLYNQYAMQDFIRSIEPGIIKSSSDLRDFIDYVKSINLNRVSALPGDIGYAADFVSDNSLSVDEAKSFLSCLTGKCYLWPSDLVKYCQKIKKDTNWRLNQIRELLSYLDSNFQLNRCYTKDKKVESESLFGLLKYFVENVKMDFEFENEQNISRSEVVSCLLYMLSNQLYHTKFKDLFSKVDEFENGKALKKVLESMGLDLAKIDFSSKNASNLRVLLVREESINDKLKNQNEKKVDDKKEISAEIKDNKHNDVNNNLNQEQLAQVGNESKEKVENSNSDNIKQNKQNLGKNQDKQGGKIDSSYLNHLAEKSKNFADFCTELNSENVDFDQIDFSKEPLGFWNCCRAFFSILFFKLGVNCGFWSLVYLKVFFENAKSNGKSYCFVAYNGTSQDANTSNETQDQKSKNIERLSVLIQEAQKKANEDPNLEDNSKNPTK